MVKFSVSQAAKLLGVSRTSLQAKINNNQLQTHEGYLTMLDLQSAYPEVNPHLEQEKQLFKIQKIKENALKKSLAYQKISAQNQLLIEQSVKKLQTELNAQKNKNQQYQVMLDELAEKLVQLEYHCHKTDKDKLHQLQNWVHQQSTNKH